MAKGAVIYERELSAFQEWAVVKGYAVSSNSGYHDVLRLQGGDGAIIFKLKSGKIETNQRGDRLVRAWREDLKMVA